MRKLVLSLGLGAALALGVVGSGMAYAQPSCASFLSAQEAIAWAQETGGGAGITDITITGDNDEVDLLKLRTLNNNSRTGLFKDLKRIELSAQTGALPDNCFYAHYTGAEWLEGFSAPHISSVGSWAFRFCTGLFDANLPEVTHIGAFAFYNSGLTGIRLPTSLLSVGDNPFLGCKNLTAITVDDGNEYFAAEDDVLYNAAKTSLIAYLPGRTGDSYAAPATVKTVASNAFGICTGLSEVELSEVTSIGDWASEYCTGLKSLTFVACDAINFGVGVFDGVTTKSIDLYLNAVGEEYLNNVSGDTWKDYTWKSVNETTAIPEIPTAEEPATEEPSVSLYPSPVKDMLHVRSNEQISGVAVYDMNAKVVLQTAAPADGLNMSALPDGLYIVKITAESGVKKEPILKIK
ncbi:MAG: leucine-rich repeat protein [Prevotella sp.]|jgi:hypothetical protein|nr:leucine-rich repeat protein [Prevotella sp.]